MLRANNWHGRERRPGTKQGSEGREGFQGQWEGSLL